MAEDGRRRVEGALARHYAKQREGAAPEALNDLAALMVAEAARDRGVRRARIGGVAFVATQVRYIPAWTWAAQLALVALMGVLSLGAGGIAAAKVAIGILAAASVLVGVPTMQASKQHRVAELEYACANNAASVLVARLIVLGCSSALAVALMMAVAAASMDANAFELALWAAPPYFLSCAASLMALRKAPPSMAAALSGIWTLACCGLLVVFASALPNMYAHASLAVWACAAAAAGAWLTRELAMTVRAAAAGLDAFSPHMAKTHN